MIWSEGDMLLSEGDMLLYSVCAEALDEDQPSAWKVLSRVFYSSISACGLTRVLVWSAAALRHCWWGYGVGKDL